MKMMKRIRENHRMILQTRRKRRNVIMMMKMRMKRKK
jgi:hypothetical protein